MTVKVPSLTAFLIIFSIISWMAPPSQCQDLNSIISGNGETTDSLQPKSDQDSPPAAAPGSLLPPPPSVPIQTNQESSPLNSPGEPTASLDIFATGPSNAMNLPRDPLEPYMWNIQMAEMSFTLNNDASSYGKLITARIHLIEAACLKPILEGKREQATELCSNVRESVLNDFANVPAAVCARDGMESSTCKEAHLKLPVENLTYFPTQKEKAENDFIGITDPTQEINTLSTELSSALAIGIDDSKEKIEELKIKALNIGSKILKLACPEENYAVLPLNRNKPIKQEPVQILKMERPTPIPTRPVATPTRSPNEPIVMFTPSGFELVRLINQPCREQISKLRGMTPDAASIVCAEQGKFSPECIEAVKAEDAKFKKKTKTTPARQPSRPADPNQKIFKSF